MIHDGITAVIGVAFAMLCFKGGIITLGLMLDALAWIVNHI